MSELDDPDDEERHCRREVLRVRGCREQRDEREQRGDEEPERHASGAAARDDRGDDRGSSEQQVLRHRPRVGRDSEQVRDDLRLLLEVTDEAAFAPHAVDAEVAEQEPARVEREEH